MTPNKKPMVAPMSPDIDPEDVRARLGDEAAMLFTWLRERVSAIGDPAPVISSLTVEWTLPENQCIVARNESVAKRGWLRPMFKAGQPQTTDFEDVDGMVATATIIDAVPVPHPSRGVPLDVGRLIELMSAAHVGRPSTYAQSLQRCEEDGWLLVEDGSVSLTDAGRSTADRAHRTSAPRLDVDYYRQVEEALGRIEAGEICVQDALAALLPADRRDAAKTGCWIDEVSA